MVIGRPPNKDQVVNYVLKNFSVNDQEWVDNVLDIIEADIPLIIEGDSVAFKRKLN